MSDKELEKLKSLPVPPVRAEAKTAALAAAMAAFDAASENADEGASKADAEKNPDTPKESAEFIRLTHASQPKRRLPMRVRHGIYATAASVAVVALGLGTGMYYTGNLRMEPVGGEASSPPKESMPSSKPVTAAEEPALSQAASDSSAPVGGSSANFGRARKPDKLGIAPKSELSEVNGSPDIAAPPQSPAPMGRLAPKQKAGNRHAYKSKCDPRKKGESDSTVYDRERFDDDLVLLQPSEENRDKFEAAKINPVKQVSAEPVSTFSIDVDTASYSFVRRALNAGRMPQKNAVRVEEMINYFPYDYPVPEKAETPFQSNVTVTPAEESA